MIVNAYHSKSTDLSLAVKELSLQAKTSGLAVFFANPSYELNQIPSLVDKLFPSHTSIVGTTSYAGVILPQGYFFGEDFTLAMMTFEEKNAAFGVGLSSLNDFEKATVEALDVAEASVVRKGELPNMVWFSSTPGAEEIVTRTIINRYFNSIPIFGGSAGDDTLSKKYKIFDRYNVSGVGICVVLFYCESQNGFAFTTSYGPTNFHGKVTSAKNREIIEIDKRPAADVFNEWRGGDLTSYITDSESNIFKKTFLRPLGKFIGEVYGVPNFLLNHIEKITPDRGLWGFTEFAVGDEVYLMETTPEGLVDRVEGAIEKALYMVDDRSKVTGALITYCGGCFMGMVASHPDSAKIMHQKILKSLLGIPFLTFFSLGEQGAFSREEVHHGNLMLVIIIFTELE